MLVKYIFYKDNYFLGIMPIIVTFAPCMTEFELSQKIGKELTEAQLREAAAKALGVRENMVGEVKVIRRSIDARQDILYRYRVQACRSNEKLEAFSVAPYQDVHEAAPVVVIGAGPAGMFAALTLLQRGL